MTSFDLGQLGWKPELAASLDPQLVLARVAVQYRGEYAVYAEVGERRARLPGRLLRAGVVAAVGDWVGLDGETIVTVLPRHSAIVRNTAGRKMGAQVLAANVDVAFVVSSLGPDLEPRRLERYLTAIWDSGASPVVLLTKADLHDDASEQAASVETVTLDVPVHVVSAVTGEGCDRVAGYLPAGATGVLLGSSGVGKSTLINRLTGSDNLRTQPIRADDGKGRHTTIQRELVLLPGGGVLIDTPGLRELQLWDGDADGLERAFADVEALAAECHFADCTHTREPGCSVLSAVEAGSLSLERLRSWRNLQHEQRGQTLRQGDPGARQRERGH